MMQNSRLLPRGDLRFLIEPYAGVLIATSILSFWGLSLAWFLTTDLADFQIIGLIPALWLRTFLQTGLFITVHDAMHGILCSQHRRLNTGLGTLAAALYALLPYKQLLIKHQQHHRAPATGDDPDFYEAQPDKFWAWYYNFMSSYLSGRQTWVLVFGMGVIFMTLNAGLHIAAANLIVFWVLPIVLSSLQLFYFGVYLPHRPQPGGYRDRHRAFSSDRSELWSFLTCYHFGYHWEHHEYPNLPWYALASVRKR